MTGQTVVTNEPDQAYEGKAQFGGQYPTTRDSYLASELIYFGKAVSLLSETELEVGGATGGPQSVKLPAAAADVTDLLLGVAVADPSVERIVNNGIPAAFGAFNAETSLSVLRKGAVWVVVATALSAFSDGVYVLFQNPGGTPPTDSLGSFDTVAGADVQVVAAGMAWKGSATVGGVDFGLLEINLPA